MPLTQTLDIRSNRSIWFNHDNMIVLGYHCKYYVFKKYIVYIFILTLFFMILNHYSVLFFYIVEPIVEL